MIIVGGAARTYMRRQAATPLTSHVGLRTVHPVGGSSPVLACNGGPEKPFQGSFGWRAGRGLPGCLLGDAVVAGNPSHRRRQETIRPADRADAVQEGTCDHLH